MDSERQLEKTWLSQLAEAELNGLKAEGINPTWEEVCRINQLSLNIEKQTKSLVSVTGKPERLSGRTLWPFTIQAGEWYSWAIDELREDLFLMALIFAHENGRESGAFDSMYNVAHAVKALKKYKRTLSCTLEEALSVISKLNEDALDSTANDAEGEDMESVIAFLVAETGRPAEEWKTRVSVGYVIAQIDAITAMKSENQADTRAKYLKAEREMGLALIAIRKNHG